ncbi:hypothetical protein QOZ80_5BG0409830 [Eleusine coracana subsp. coracana]|nr:hypothetical protein QOZ80_5BG0409830 [Eleusine coracana subsp. coracana]
MVKLATAREARLYGPALAVRRWEYMNAGVYVFATLLLASSLAALFDVGGAARAGLAAAGVALAVAAAVNAHDLWAHLAGVDWRIGLARYDLQLGLVELLVPAMHAVGCVLAVVAMAILISQGEEGYSYGKERHAANLVVAAALLWMVGSVLNACQVYERADGRAQLLQATVQVPLLLGSLFFLLAAVANRGRTRSPLLVSRSWVWLSLLGSVLWLVGALFNVLKVFMMHQSDALRLEKLRGGAQERLSRDREGRVPLNWEEAARRTELR